MDPYSMIGMGMAQGFGAGMQNPESNLAQILQRRRMGQQNPMMGAANAIGGQGMQANPMGSAANAIGGMDQGNPWSQGFNPMAMQHANPNASFMGGIGQQMGNPMMQQNPMAQRRIGMPFNLDQMGQQNPMAKWRI